MNTGAESNGEVVAVAAHPDHRFSKSPREAIQLVAGGGVQGDAHFGATVRHRSRVAVDPSQPNLRQVHLIHAELHAELRAKGFDVGPAVMGENVTTRGIDLLALPTGALLKLGEDALVAVTGLRNPCRQLDDYAQGLLAAVLDRDANGGLIRKAGVMGVVLRGGSIRPGDRIAVACPPGPHRRLERV
jgi:hypothetical protein